MDTEKIKIYAGVISLVITGIVSISTALMANSKADKASQEETAKASYKELSAAVEQMSRDQITMSKDLASLRGYVAGLNQQPIITTPEIPISTKSRVRISGTRPTSGSSIGASAPIPPLPPISSSPKPFVAKGLDSL